MLGSRRLGSLLPGLARARGLGAASAFSQPLLGEGTHRHNSTFSAQDVEAAQAAPVDESWWREVQDAADSGGGEGQPQRRRTERLNAPIDKPRTLIDYQKMVLALSRRKRAYLIRDVVDEMSLSGIRPDKFVLQTGLFACMKNRKLGDAMFFFEEMKRRGMEPDATSYGTAISACGRAGQLGQALQLKVEMLARGMQLSHNTRLALLNAFAEAGKMQATRRMFDEIAASGRPACEFAFAALANCYRHLAPRAVPADVEAQLLGLLDEFKAARAASASQAQAAQAAQAGADAGTAHGEAHTEPPSSQENRDSGSGGGGDGRYQPLLVVYNAVMNSLAELGRHEAAVSLYNRMGEEGLSPDHTSYSNIIRSYMQQALGRHRQPSSDQLTAILDERLRHEDLQADIEAVLADNQALKAALDAAAAAGSGSGAGGAGTAAAAEITAEGAKEGLEGEEEEQPGTAALRALGNDVQAGEGGEEDAEDYATPATAAAAGADQQQQPSSQGSRNRRQQPHGSFAGLSEAQLRGMVREQAAQRARSRLRFGVFREHLDVDAWYEALHIFQEVLDQGLLWGPEITYAMLKASLDLQAAGVEHAMDVAHTVMDTFDRQGLFVDVDNGTEVLLLAVRRDVADLSLAHRVYDNMRRTQRVPKTPCMFKYMRALAQREPEAKERLVEVCSRICSDPDKSITVMGMKKEAYQRRQQLLASNPQLAEQQRRQQQHHHHARGGGGGGARFADGRSGR